MKQRPDVERTVLKTILTNQLQRYPLMQLDDLYKLIFQAAMGSEHAVPDREAAASYLQEELKRMGSGPEEPLIDPIAPDGRIVRVHLRPYLQSGEDPAMLLRAFLRTADRFQGSLEKLAAWWKDAIAVIEEQQLPLQVEPSQAFFTRMAEMGFPAVHHSQAYLSAYKPAYRVVLKDTVE
jgi:hypothetical protein